MSKAFFTSVACFGMLLFIGAGCTLPGPAPTPEQDAMMEQHDDAMMEKDSETAMEEHDNTMMDGDEMMEKDDSVMMDEKSAGRYEAYDEKKLAYAENGHVVLFFHAGWCPTCRALDADIQKNLSSIPSDVTILKVDYDTAVALKKQYGVTVQHTLVEVDKDANLIEKWSGGNSLDTILSHL